MTFRSILFIPFLFTFLFAEANNHFNLKTIVIDAGHGGKDPGAIGPDKIYEKDVALAVALKLGEYIQKNFPDVKVIYTRKTDVFVELHERAEIANRAKADLFIAIHCNSSPNTDFYGSSAYVLGLHRTEANLEVAKRENSVINLEEDRDKNYEFDPNTPEGHIIMSMKQNAFLDQSIAFAAKIENELEGAAQRKSLGVKQAGFYVLYKTTMPSVLAEIGFISSPEEEKYLNTEHGQTLIASALFDAFRDYKNEMEGGEPETKNTARTTDTKNSDDTAPETKIEKKDTIVVDTTVVNTAKESIASDVPARKDTVKAIAKTTETKIVKPALSADRETPKTTAASVVTLSDGTKVQKPIDNGGGGGKNITAKKDTVVKTTVVATTMEETKPTKADTVRAEISSPKETAKNNNATKTVSTPIKTETKTVAAEKISPVKTETKTTSAPTETKQIAAPATPTVLSNRHPLVPLMQNENGTIFRVQLFALKGTLKEYDKLIKIFKVMCAEELGGGLTRYYGSKTTSFAEAEKFHQAAVNNGFKDSYIVGFKDGKRLSATEFKALE